MIHLKRLTITLFCIAVVAIAIPQSAFAGQIVIGGVISDWGVTLSSDHLQFGFTKVGGGAPANPSSGLGMFKGFQFLYQIEDQSDSAGTSGYLGPHSGGQNYDAEFMAVGIDGPNLVIAIATGQRFDNPADQYAPGDIRITTSDPSITFGIEVGGGTGGSSYSSRTIVDGNAGTTYTLNSAGYTVSSATSSKKVGSIWQTTDADWILSPTTPNTPTQLKSTGGAFVGNADLVYNAPSGSQHAFIEVSIPLSYFVGVTSIESVRWAPACNNDVLETGPLSIVPEPASLSLLLIGGLGIFGIRRRSGKSRPESVADSRAAA